MQNSITWVGMDAHKNSIKVAALLPEHAEPVEWTEDTTPEAIRRGLSYYRGARRMKVVIEPAELGFDAVGHFGLFHDRHRDGFWAQTLAWLGEVNKALVIEMADLFAEKLKWSAKVRDEEVTRTIAHLKEYHGVELK